MDSGWGRDVLSELQKAEECIRQNWSDPLATQYLEWLKSVEADIKNLEIQREKMLLRAQKIQLLCQSAAESGEDPQPKVLTLGRGL